MNNPYDNRAVSANQANDPGMPEGYQVVETAPGTFETVKVTQAKQDTAGAEMLNLVGDIPNQMVDNGRSKSFVFGATMDDFNQTGSHQDGVQADPADGQVVINGQVYRTGDLTKQAAPVQAPEAQTWDRKIRAQYGAQAAEQMGVPSQPQPTKAPSWWKKK